MRAESFPGRVVPLPLRSMNCGFRIDDELVRAWRITPLGGAARRSLTEPPDLRVDVITLDREGRIERPWRAGRVVLQCLEGYIRVAMRDGAHDLVEGEIISTEARLIQSIEAREPGAVMATIVGVPDRTLRVPRAARSDA